LVIVLVTLALVLFLWPMVFPGRNRAVARRHQCLSNLREAGLAFRMWAGDHGEKFPLAVSTNAGGSLEFAGTSEAFRHFVTLTNELIFPIILACPSDPSRRRTTNFATFNNQNLSYFVGLDAVGTDRQMILSGDRNLSTNETIMSGILTLASDTPGTWTKDIHVQAGNIGLADGSVQQVDDSVLNRQVASSAHLPERLAIP
jgi:hypothetical protein